MMAETGAKVKEAAMFYNEEGDSFYSRNNPVAFEVYNSVFKHTKEHIQDRLKKFDIGYKDQVVHIADFGTADGGGFFHLVPQLIDTIRRSLSRDVAVKLLLNDKKENDFVAVQKNFEERVSLDDVTYSCNDESFYKQCFAEETITMGFCLTSVHWLSSRPTLNEGRGSWEVCPPVCEHSEFCAQAEWDWNSFLLHRARELVKGGMLLVSTLGTNDDGSICSGAKNTRKLVSECWQHLATQEIITQFEQNNAIYPKYYRTKAELRKPFEDPNSEVCKAGLKLLDINTYVIACPIYKTFMESPETTDDCNNFVENFIQKMKCYSYNLHYVALDKSRSDEEKTTICEEFFSIMETAVAKEPQKYSNKYIMHEAFIVKDFK